MVRRLLERFRDFARGLRQSAASPVRLDLRSLAALRIGLAATMLIDLSIRASDMAAHYGFQGIYKCTTFAALRAPWKWDLFPCQPGDHWVYLHFGLHAVVGFCLLLGLGTRLATVASWVLLTSLHHRDPLVLNGGDALLRLLTLWSIFLPLGARWSLDARWFRPVVERNTVHTPATLAYCLQVLVVYPLVIYARRNDAAWWGGDALSQIVQFDLFATRIGVWLRELPTVLRVSNYATMFWELWGPAFALLPVFGRGWLRTAVVFAFIGLHIGMGVVVNVGTFPLISAAGWIAFLPGGFWDTLLSRRSAEAAARDNPPWWLDRRRHPGRLRRGTEHLLAYGFAGALLVYGALWNAQRMKVYVLDPVFASAGAKLPGQLLRVDQSWRMFSSPPRGDGWFLMVASLADGTSVDLLRNGAPVNFTRPAFVLDNIPSRRWGKLLMQLRKKTNKKHRSRFLAHYARVWNERAPCAQQIVGTDLVFMAEKKEGGVKKKVLWHLTPRSQRKECSAQLSSASPAAEAR
jgi:hypothetical protein